MKSYLPINQRAPAGFLYNEKPPRHTYSITSRGNQSTVKWLTRELAGLRDLSVERADSKINNSQECDQGPGSDKRLLGYTVSQSRQEREGSSLQGGQTDYTCAQGAGEHGYLTSWVPGSAEKKQSGMWGIRKRSYYRNVISGFRKLLPKSLVIHSPLPYPTTLFPLCPHPRPLLHHIHCSDINSLFLFPLEDTVFFPIWFTDASRRCKTDP